MASQIHFSSWNRHTAAVVGTAVQQPSAESTKHTCVQGYMATSCDRSQVKEVVGVVPLVLRDGKSSCSRGRRVKLESRQGGEPFSELRVFQERTENTGQSARSIFQAGADTQQPFVLLYNNRLPNQPNTHVHEDIWRLPAIDLKSRSSRCSSSGPT